MSHTSPKSIHLTLILSAISLYTTTASLLPRRLDQVVLSDGQPGSGHNELYIPDYNNPVPGKIPYHVNEQVHYYEKHINGDGIRRSPCPAVNTLANRGYVNRSGRNISYEEIAQAARDVYNFGDDNVSAPSESGHVAISMAWNSLVGRLSSLSAPRLLPTQVLSGSILTCSG